MIITSLLDTDFYKFTMGQAVLHNYPSSWVKYKFKCRNPQNFNPDANFLKELDEQINYLCSLQFNKCDLRWLSSILLFKPDFIEYLRLFKLNRKYITTTIVDGELEITIEGPWIATIWFEAPILAIVSELWGLRSSNLFDTWAKGKKRLSSKIDDLNNFKTFKNKPLCFSDFGTRRRFGRGWHRKVISAMVNDIKNDGINFAGTSNVMFAKDYNIKPIGTMAHEWFQGHQQIGGSLRDHMSVSLEVWSKEYRGELGIALTDIIGMDAFLKDFDLYFAKLYDGGRHDSDDPYVWCDKFINHYMNFGIDPRTKKAVFSDGLNFPKMFDLYNTYENLIQTSYGLGTNLTNDMGTIPLKIVIKMVECNGRPVAKISDSPGKGMCEDENFLNHLKTTFNVK